MLVCYLAAVSLLHIKYTLQVKSNNSAKFIYQGVRVKVKVIEKRSYDRHTHSLVVRL